MNTIYKIEIPARKLFLVYVPIILGAIVIVGVLALVLVDKVLMPNYTNVSNRGEIIVPLVVGKSHEEAAKILNDMRLHLNVGVEEYSDKPEGQIIFQQPSPESIVKTGRHIFVTVSKGDEVATIPSVKRLAEGPTKSAIRKAGFNKIMTRYIYDKQVPAGKVIGIKPASGVKTSRESYVHVAVSRGPEPEGITVPNVIGEMLSVAQEKIILAELTVGTITTESGSSFSAGQVISQSLAPGTSSAILSKVDLVVAAE